MNIEKTRTKKQLVMLFVFAVSLALAGQIYGKTVRRVRLQANNATVFAPDTFIIAAEGTEGVGGAGTDLTSPTEGNYCDIHFNKVSIDEDGDAAVLVGKVIEASDPNNYGAFVQITAHTNGKVNFVFRPINPNGGPATIVDFTGATVTIVGLP